MLELPTVYKPSFFGDEIILRSIDWLENFPWRQETQPMQGYKDKYEILVNVKDFAPEEIKVRTSDEFVIIEGKHDEKQDEYGFISRHFVRKYRFPEGCKLGSVESKLSPDGVLVVSAPRNVMVKQDTVIPVSHERSKAKSKM